MKLANLLSTIQALAPHPLAEPWDQVGLHLGDPDRAVKTALLCIDLTEQVLQEAIAQRAQLVIAYHPPIFKPLDRLTTEDPKQRIIFRAARANIAVYSPHTALDAARGGVNDWLASGLGKGEVHPIKPGSADGGPGSGSYKLVTFVPEASVDAVRSALAGAGAGQIGNYSECSFTSQGQGTFRGDTRFTHPAVGKAGRFESVPERRLEMLIPGSLLAQAVLALRQAHPYEEPAFDVYPLQPVPASGDTQVGQGRVVTLDRPASLTTIINRIKAHLKVKTLEVASPAGLGKVHRIGLCAGAGGSLLADAGRVDAFFTGEMRHHDVLDAVSRGTAVILAGHTQTERPYLPTYRRRLAGETGKAVRWLVSKADRPPSAFR